MSNGGFSVGAALAAIAMAAGCSGESTPRPTLNTGGIYDGVVTLSQGWDDAARNRFYHDPQGSPIMPYAWFLKLEQPGKAAPFRDRAYLESFGLIHWGQPDPALNPDGLPAGLTRDHDIFGERGGAKLGMNCGACHVDQITVAGRKVLIDGGSSHFDLWAFMEALRLALEETYRDDDKFERFALQVLDAGASAQDRAGLRAHLRTVLGEREDWAFRNRPGLTPGPGRIDALGIILNQVTARMLHRPDNARPPDAPVSFPFVWDAPYLDFVQYNASVPNAGAGSMGRNVGQVLGVFGEASLLDADLPPGYPNSVRTHYLLDLEEAMQTLLPPSWRELADRGVLPRLDEDKVAKGAKVYAETCVGCHRVIDRSRPHALASIPVERIPAAELRTDPEATVRFAQRTSATGPIKGRAASFLKGPKLCERAYADEVLEHVAIGVIINDLRHGAGWLTRALGERIGHALEGFLARIEGWFSRKPDLAAVNELRASGAATESLDRAVLVHVDDNAMALDQALRDDGGYTPEEPSPDCSRDPASELAARKAKEVYRARPLDGIWATGPYLHNGSVPTLADLLTPPHERPKQFNVGSREFDPVRVGFLDREEPGTMRYDTSLPGNSNLGHPKGLKLSAEEREQLLEYLKSL